MQLKIKDVNTVEELSLNAKFPISQDGITAQTASIRLILNLFKIGNLEDLNSLNIIDTINNLNDELNSISEVVSKALNNLNDRIISNTNKLENLSGNMIVVESSKFNSLNRKKDVFYIVVKDSDSDNEELILDLIYLINDCNSGVPTTYTDLDEILNEINGCEDGIDVVLMFLINDENEGLPTNKTSEELILLINEEEPEDYYLFEINGIDDGVESIYTSISEILDEINDGSPESVIVNMMNDEDEGIETQYEDYRDLLDLINE